MKLFDCFKEIILKAPVLPTNRNNFCTTIIFFPFENSFLELLYKSQWNFFSNIVNTYICSCTVSSKLTVQFERNLHFQWKICQNICQIDDAYIKWASYNIYFYKIYIVKIFYIFSIYLVYVLCIHLKKWKIYKKWKIFVFGASCMA